MLSDSRIREGDWVRVISLSVGGGGKAWQAATIGRTGHVVSVNRTKHRLVYVVRFGAGMGKRAVVHTLFNEEVALTITQEIINAARRDGLFSPAVTTK